MASDKAIGGTVLGGSIIGIVLYAFLLITPQTSDVTLKVTAFIGVGALLTILAWIGWTMATTPPPEPIADIPGTTPETKPGSDKP